MSITTTRRGRATRACGAAALLTAATLGAGGCSSTPRGGATPLPTETGVPVNQWYMRTQDEVVHYVAEYGREAKPGNVAIVLHGGWGAEHSYLLPAVLPLADEFRLAMYDQRGSLRSPVRPPARVSYAALVEDLDQLRQRLGLEKVTLVAHSMGNHLAYAYLRAHPDRVAGLVLVGATTPAPFGEARPAFLADVWPDFSDADAEALAARQREFDRSIFDRAVRIAADEGIVPDEFRNARPGEPGLSEKFEAATSTDQAATAWWRVQFTCVNTFGGRNWRQMGGGQVFYSGEAGQAVLEDPDYQAATPEFWGALKSFDGPVRVIIGTHDYVDLGPTMWPRLTRALKHGRLTVIPNSGHSIWMDEPRAFEAALRKALRDTAGTR